MGKECCGVNFITNILIVFNIIFLLAGFFVVGVAVASWTIFDGYQYVSLLASITYPIIVWSLIVAGSLVVISAIIGCFASIRKNRCLLILYVFILVLIFSTEAMVGIVAFLYNENVQTELKLNLNETFLTSYQKEEDQTAAIDYLQQHFQCCGAEAFSDWQYSQWLSKKNKVPDSCCKSMVPGCGRRDHPSNIYYTGCLDQMALHMKDHLVILSAVGLGICVIQIFGVIFAIKLYLRLRSSSTRDPGEREFLNKG